ncbi:MAG: butyrate kinase [Clostridiales bacterium]|nr:MAG: butyrate kinase [Clostridiales bacterium]
MARQYILVINPGSTSTKVAVFREATLVIEDSLTHSTSELDQFANITDQFDYRKAMILSWLKANAINLDQVQAVVARGGLLRPMPSGIYKVSSVMIDDLRVGIQGDHASNLGGIIAKSIADGEGIEAFIVDPVAVDEFDDVARVSGMPDLVRKSLVHALNVRAIGHNVAHELGRPFNEMNMVIAHLGGGISIVPLRKGKMIDANNANEMGPFSPERSGGLPVTDLVKMCYSGDYTMQTLKPKIRGKGGLIAYLGTGDAREIVKRIEQGDRQAALIYQAMAYQIAKEIGAMATVLAGNIDAIVLTGGVAYSKYLTDYVSEHISFIAPVIIKPGEDEMTALNAGYLRMLSGEEKVKIYEDEVTL